MLKGRYTRRIQCLEVLCNVHGPGLPVHISHTDKTESPRRTEVQAAIKFAIRIQHKPPDILDSDNAKENVEEEMVQDANQRGTRMK